MEDKCELAFGKFKTFVKLLGTELRKCIHSKRSGEGAKCEKYWTIEMSIAFIETRSYP